MRGRAIVQWRFGSPPRLSSGNSGTDPTHHLCYPSTLEPIGGVPVIKPGIRSSNDTDKWGRPPSGAFGVGRLGYLAATLSVAEWASRRSATHRPEYRYMLKRLRMPRGSDIRQMPLPTCIRRPTRCPVDSYRSDSYLPLDNYRNLPYAGNRGPSPADGCPSGFARLVDSENALP